MMKEIPTATAVIVNPTHYAVALKYDHEDAGRAAGGGQRQNYLALRIRQKAIEHQIPLIENPPLAQALYKNVDVGQEIPAHFYRAVAEVLAYIYQADEWQADLHENWTRRQEEQVKASWHKPKP